MKKLFLMLIGLFTASTLYFSVDAQHIRSAENKSGKTVRITGGAKTIKTLEGKERVRVGGDYLMAPNDTEQYKNFNIPKEDKPLKIEMLDAKGNPEKTLYLFMVGKSAMVTQTEPTRGDVFSIEILKDTIKLTPLEK